jgi:predicted transcriptional regulator
VPANNDNLKEVASKLSLQKGSTHEHLRKLIVDDFFGTVKTTNEIIEEIRQTAGKRIESSVVQTYMKKFMDKGIIRALKAEKSRGNFWILANHENVKEAQAMLKSQTHRNVVEALALPTHSLLASTKTKILFLAASPAGMTPLALDKESREIEEKIRASKHRDGLEFITRWAVRTGDLLQYLNEHNAHIIHFSGHGSLKEELFLADANDVPKPVTKAALKHLFATLKDNIRVVVLNACYSRPQAEAITEVIDCAIGMNKAIGDEAAIVFAAAFYQGIGFGRSVKQAFDSGKAALMLEGIPEEQTPELLIRKGIDPDKIFLIDAISSKT